jgi:hypothetical protein
VLVNERWGYDYYAHLATVNGTDVTYMCKPRTIDKKWAMVSILAVAEIGAVHILGIFETYELKSLAYALQ